jgi:hypothetical protein
MSVRVGGKRPFGGLLVDSSDGSSMTERSKEKKMRAGACFGHDSSEKKQQLVETVEETNIAENNIQHMDNENASPWCE